MTAVRAERSEVGMGKSSKSTEVATCVCLCWGEGRGVKVIKESQGGVQHVMRERHSLCACARGLSSSQREHGKLGARRQATAAAAFACCCSGQLRRLHCSEACSELRQLLARSHALEAGRQPRLARTCWMFMVPSSCSSSNSSGEKPPSPTAARTSASADLVCKSRVARAGGRLRVPILIHGAAA